MSVRLITGPQLEDYLRLVGDTDVQLPNHRIHSLIPGADVSRALFLPLMSKVRDKVAKQLPPDPVDKIGPGGLSQLTHKTPSGDQWIHNFSAGNGDVTYVEDIVHPFDQALIKAYRGWNMKNGLATSLRVDIPYASYDLITEDIWAFGSITQRATLKTAAYILKNQFFSTLTGSELYQTAINSRQPNVATSSSTSYPAMNAHWEHMAVNTQGDELKRILMKKLDSQGGKEYVAEQAISKQAIKINLNGGAHKYKSLTLKYDDRDLVSEISYSAPGKPVQTHYFIWTF